MSTETSAYLSRSAVTASLQLNAEAIIADTSSGRTIRNIAAFRGRKTIFAQCNDKRAMRELAISFGVYPSYIEPNEKHTFVHESQMRLVVKKHLKENDRVVILGGNFGKT